MKRLALLASIAMLGIGVLVARQASAAAVNPATPPSNPQISTAWVTCNGHLQKSGDIRGAIQGYAESPFITAVTRIRTPLHAPQPQKGFHVVGFAGYRSWASPHWLQAESFAAATLCTGPWTAAVDGRGAAYTPGTHGPAVPPGRYSLALLWRGPKTPARSLLAELSNRQLQLPLQAGVSVVIWGCTGGGMALKCRSALFQTF